MRAPTLAAAPPLTEAQLARADALASELDAFGLAWLSGFAAGVARGRAAPAGALEPVRDTAVPAHPLTIVYGSQTGNARRVAEQVLADCEAAGLPARLLRADAYPVRDLKTERHLVVVISTQGDGDPPDDARDFFDHVTGNRAPKLDQLQYAVLGLGDSSYPRFNAVGHALDERLAALGATRWLSRGSADVDVDTVSDPWRAQLLARARETVKPSATITPLRPPATAAARAEPTHTRAHPFHADVLANQRITAPGSAKDVRHVELSIEGAGWAYEPGDALGVWPRNPDALVEQLLVATGLEGDAVVAHAGTHLPLRDWLRERRELTRLSRPFVAAHAEQTADGTLRAALAQDNATALHRLLAEAQVIDLLQQHPGKWSAEALVAALRPLTPRLYSIASSPREAGDEVHLTVAHVAYQANGQARWGAASHLVATRHEGATLPVYLEANERFRLPADRALDVIMIGPGTGVAPFRAFVQDRRATRATQAGHNGRNWLFFGNPYFRSDFLYQLEWQRALRDGTLDRIDLAFSRDDPGRKTYVQHCIAERSRELYDWLEGGAHLYVCGAIAMGKDVHGALLEAVAAHNGGDREAATRYLNQLAREGRYARDVY